MTFIRRPFLLLLLTLGILSIPSGVAHAQVITAQVTVTNITTNGYTMSVNGNLRTWTNYITSANNQIQVATNGAVVLGTDATNLFWAYAVYPENNIRLSQIATNVLQFQGYYSGVPVTIALSSGWGSVTYYTNTPTNFIVVSVPSNGVPVTTMSIWERTNIESGLISLLDDNCMVAPVNASDPAWVEFLSTNFGAAMTNFVLLVGTNTTNFAKSVGLNGTNFSLAIGALETNQTTNMGYVLTNYVLTATNNALAYDQTIFASITTLAAWQDSGIDVLLTNEFGVVRMDAADNGGAFGNYTGFYGSDGNQSYPWLYNDGNDDTLIKDRASGSRIEVDDALSGNSNTYIRGGIGANLPGSQGPYLNGGEPIGGGMAIGGTRGTVFTSFPAVEQFITLPAVLIGSVTNFASVAFTANGIYNTFNIPGDTLTNAGDTVVRTIGMTLASASGYSFEIEFNGQVVFDSGSFNSSGIGAISVTTEITTDASGTFHYNSHMVGGNTTTSVTVEGTNYNITIPDVVTYCGHHTFNTGTSTNFYIAVGTYVGTDDMTVETDNTKLEPSPIWATLP